MRNSPLSAFTAYTEAARALGSSPDGEGLFTKCPAALAENLLKSMSRWEELARRAATLLSEYGDNPSEELSQVEQFVQDSAAAVRNE
jgi:hypothetical protein